MTIDYIKYDEKSAPIIPLKSFFGKFSKPKSENLAEIADFVDKICIDTGCFMISDIPDFDWDLVDKCFKDAEQFFRLPLDEKMIYHKSGKKHPPRGYEPLGSRNVSAVEGRLGRPYDAYETLLFGPPNVKTATENGGDSEKQLTYDFYTTPNVYPKNPPTLQKNFDNLFKQFTHVANVMKQIFSIALGQEPDYLQEVSASDFNFLRANFYPITTPEPAQDRVAEHADLAPFTIACPSACENSLMVKNKTGEWSFVNPPPKTLFVNIGQILARLTNGHWTATPHKVVFPGDLNEIKERLALICFVGFDPDTKMKCLPNFLTTGGKNYEYIVYRDIVTYIT